MSSHFRVHPLVHPDGSQSHFIFYFVKYRQSLVCSGTFVIGQCHLPVPGMWNRVGVKLIPNWRGGEPTFRDPRRKNTVMVVFRDRAKTAGAFRVRYPKSSQQPYPESNNNWFELLPILLHFPVVTITIH